MCKCANCACCHKLCILCIFCAYLHKASAQRPAPARPGVNSPRLPLFHGKRWLFRVMSLIFAVTQKCRGQKWLVGTARAQPGLLPQISLPQFKKSPLPRISLPRAKKPGLPQINLPLCENSGLLPQIVCREPEKVRFADDKCLLYHLKEFNFSTTHKNSLWFIPLQYLECASECELTLLAIRQGLLRSKWIWFN